MNNQVIADSARDLFMAMRSRWRTGGTQASMTLSQASPGAESSYAARRARPRTLSESNPTGVVVENSLQDEPIQTGHRFIRMSDCLDAFNQAWKASGIKDKNEFIRTEFVNQEKEYVRMTGTMDAYSRKAIFGESSGQAANPDVQDYDPASPEPRFLQIAKAELLRRRDLKCRDCGFTGLPASVDGNCPECGGLMDAPELQTTTAASTADQIRAAIRQQVQDQQVGLKRDNSTQESVHTSVSNHPHDIHLADLVAHYGFKANGDHYVVDGESDSRLYVRSGGAWIHKHHGVHHEGHGFKSLSHHLSRYGNHRSKR